MRVQFSYNECSLAILTIQNTIIYNQYLIIYNPIMIIYNLGIVYI